MQRLMGGSHGGVGVARPQSLRGVGVAREDRITRVEAFDPAQRTGKLARFEELGPQ